MGAKIDRPQTIELSPIQFEDRGRSVNTVVDNHSKGTLPHEKGERKRTGSSKTVRKSDNRLLGVICEQLFPHRVRCIFGNSTPGGLVYHINTFCNQVPVRLRNAVWVE